MKSPTISVWGLMCNLSLSNVSFTYVCVLISGLKLHLDELLLL